MAQNFIQSTQLSPVQGSAGSQTVVQNQGPTLGEGLSNTIQATANLIDTAGSIYGQNRANSLIQEELQNIDRARAVAEKGGFILGDPVPESVKLDQKEWDMLFSAVQSGQLSREKARLLASSRLRSRIAEEPLFADRIRQAASKVLGFNIESEGARQYFAALPTEASLAGRNKNEYWDKLSDRADTIVKLGIASDKTTVMQWLAKVDIAETENTAAELQAKAGVRSANDMANILIKNHDSTVWGKVLGDIKATEAETGQPVKPEEFTRKLLNSRLMFEERFKASWVEAGGDLNSEEYNRHLNNINQTYQQMEDFIKEIGVDNLNKISIERQQAAFDILGTAMMPQLTLVSRTLGQQVATDLINLAATNPTKRDLLMQQSPELASFFNLLGKDPREFNKYVTDAAIKLVQGGNIEDLDPAVVDYTVKSLHDNGSPETKEAVIRTLAEKNLNWKGLSLLANSRAYLEPKENKEYFKVQYKQGLPEAIKALSQEVSSSPAINVDVNDDGNIVVSQDSAGGAMPQTAFGGLVVNPQQVQQDIVTYNRAKQLADKVNLFNKAIKRGFDSVVGVTPNEYKNFVADSITKGVATAKDTQKQELASSFFERLQSRDLVAARKTYEDLRKLDPEAYNATWEEVLEEVESRLKEGQEE